MWAQKADAFFGNFGEFEERNHLEALGIRGCQDLPGPRTHRYLSRYCDPNPGSGVHRQPRPKLSDQAVAPSDMYCSDRAYNRSLPAAPPSTL